MVTSDKFQSYKFILFAAIVVRLIAVIFSQGYGMHDDHFLIIEAAASWADGFDYNNWLPWSKGNLGAPEGHSFTYVGLNYIYFVVMKWVGIADPKILMFFNRLILAFASLVVCWFGMKITEKLSNKQLAVKVGWILALLWIMPFVSVRNLVEVVALPFLVYGVWLIVKNEKASYFFFAGLAIGMAVSFRYQIGVFAIGIAAYFFFQRKFKLFMAFSFGVLLIFTLTQGLVDYLIWGYPFAELISYITYNMKEGTAYLPNQNYFMYFLVLTACLFVPLGIVILFGFFKSYKKYAVLFFPTLLFIVFHTIYPNRQERFILSVLPFFIMLGVMGYDLWKESKWKAKIWRISMVIFVTLNIPFLLFSITTYSKKSRVESMYYLYKTKSVKSRILLEGSSSQHVSMLPKFYAQDWQISFSSRIDSTQNLLIDSTLNYDYIYFFDEKNLAGRIKAYKSIYPKMALAMKCFPSSIDVVLRELNPRNSNEYIEIWKTHASK